MFIVHMQQITQQQQTGEQGGLLNKKKVDLTF